MRLDLFTIALHVCDSFFKNLFAEWFMIHIYHTYLDQTVFVIALYLIAFDCARVNSGIQSASDV